MYACMHACMYVCMHACMHACLHARIYQLKSFVNLVLSVCPSTPSGPPAAEEAAPDRRGVQPGHRRCRRGRRGGGGGAGGRGRLHPGPDGGVQEAGQLQGQPQKPGQSRHRDTHRGRRQGTHVLVHQRPFRQVGLMLGLQAWVQFPAVAMDWFPGPVIPVAGRLVQGRRVV